MPQSSPTLSPASNSGVSSCDCLAHRFGGAADHDQRAARYPSDMSDAEWAQVRAALPVPGWLKGRGGQPEAYCHRQIIDAIRYLVHGGITWRAMPADFPRWDAVYAYFRRWRDTEGIKELHDRLRGKVRERAGRDPEPTAGIIDSQSTPGAPTVSTATRGYDAGKNINGRKRHILVDCLGLLLMVRVTAASISDREAGQHLLIRARARFPRLRLVWADSGYTGMLVDFARTLLRLALTVVKRTDQLRGFRVLPRRWVVERTFGWLVRSRRLFRDVERRTDTAEAMVYWSMTMVMSRRLASPARRR